MRSSIAPLVGLLLASLATPLRGQEPAAARDPGQASPAPQQDKRAPSRSPLPDQEPAPEEVAFWVHLDPMNLPPLAVTIAEWEQYIDYLHGIYPTRDESMFLTTVIRQMLEQKVALMMYREQIPGLLAKADEVLAKLDEGADFERMLKLYSKNPNAQVTGGRAEYRRTMRRYPLEYDAFRLETGTYGGPFFSKFGAEIIYVESRTGEPGTMRESMEVRNLLLEFEVGNEPEAHRDSRIRQSLTLRTEQERFRNLLPPALQVDPPEHFGPTDVAPLGQPDKPLEKVKEQRDG